MCNNVVIACMHDIDFYHLTAIILLVLCIKLHRNNHTILYTYMLQLNGSLATHNGIQPTDLKQCYDVIKLHAAF